MIVLWKQNFYHVFSVVTDWVEVWTMSGSEVSYNETIKVSYIARAVLLFDSSPVDQALAGGNTGPGLLLPAPVTQKQISRRRWRMSG